MKKFLISKYNKNIFIYEQMAYVFDRDRKCNKI